ncbi:MAG: Mut7-C RNAse domain-containing protein [bacterium]
MKFYVDNMLGRLARWLRILGYDAVYSKTGIKWADIQTDRTLTSEIIILTRNTRLYKNIGTRRALFIKDDHFRLQIRQVVQELGLHFQENIFLSRCVECNIPLSPIKKEKIESRIPEYVFQIQRNFYQCTQCKRIYWPGTHYFQMENEIKSFWRKES